LLPPLTVANSKTVKLVCEPQKLQIALNNPVNGNIEDVAKVIKSIVEKLPETNYTALGINFQGRLDFSSKKESFDFIKKYISVEAIPGFCNKDDDSLGVVVSLIKDKISGSRLTIKMLPGIETKRQKHILIIDFNFHNDVKSLDEIKIKLGNVRSKEQKSLELLEVFKNASK